MITSIKQSKINRRSFPLQARNNQNQQPLSALQKRQVKQIASSPLELKVFGQTSIGASCTTSGASLSLTDVPQGITDITRLGDALQGVSMELAIDVNSTVASTVSSNVRVILFTWNQETAPTTANVIEGALLTTSNCPLGYIDFDSRKYIKVLVDELISLPMTYLSASQARVTMRFKVPVKNKINFQTGSTTGANKIYLFYSSDKTTDVPKLSYVSAFYFTDA